MNPLGGVSSPSGAVGLSAQARECTGDLTVALRHGAPMPLANFSTRGQEEEAIYRALINGFRGIDVSTDGENCSRIRTAVQRSGLCRQELFYSWQLIAPEVDVEQSLQLHMEELGIDYIDLLMVSPEVPTLSTLLKLQPLQKRGIVRHIGARNFRVPELELAKQVGVPISANQVEFRAGFQGGERGSIHRYCRENDIQLMSHRPLANIWPEAIQSIARNHGATSDQIALRWLTQLGIPFSISEHSDQKQRACLDLSLHLTPEETCQIDHLPDGARFDPSAESLGEGQLCFDPDIWLSTLEEKVSAALAISNDASHDLEHMKRVATRARRFAAEEDGPAHSELVCIAAGILHDIVNLPKNHPDRKQASLMAAAEGEKMLRGLSFPRSLLSNVCHSIHAHSFSAKVSPVTMEAKCVQDADRIEALGALGIMRAFYISGLMGGSGIDLKDPLAECRELDDKKYALDHFAVKLLKLSDTMQTNAGRKRAQDLTRFLQDFRSLLARETLDGGLEAVATTIAAVCHCAGANRSSLFHPQDPFAQFRSLDPRAHALDLLQVLHNDSHVDLAPFLQQLASELEAPQAIQLTV